MRKAFNGNRMLGKSKINQQPNKSPGSDGLSAEFYRQFWKEIHHYFLNALNYGYRNGILSVTQRRGLITALIPKKKNKSSKPLKKLAANYSS